MANSNTTRHRRCRAAQILKETDAGKSRHAYIDYHHVKWGRPILFERRHSIATDFHLISGTFQDTGNVFQYGIVIVDDERAPNLFTNYICH